MQWQSPNDASMHRPLIAPHHVRPIPENMHLTSTASSAPPSSSSQRSSGWSSFPGRRSAARPTAAAASENLHFIGTGGNALQAVSREEAQDQGLVAVTVPMGTVSGQKIMVAVPDGTGRLVEAIVPPGIYEGHTFLVRIPPVTLNEHEAAAVLESEGTRPSSWVPPHAGYMVPYEGGNIPTAPATVAPPVPGHDANSVPMAQAWQPPNSAPSGSAPLPTATPFSQALDGPAPNRSRNPRERSNNNSNSNTDSDLVLVRVPPGVAPGTALRVQVDDGRIIEATVPSEPGVTEFYVRVPPPPPASASQNWHNHPLAIAPMAVGPFLT